MISTPQDFRPAAVPLTVSDPYFSLWSFEDKLYCDYTRHWNGRVSPMFAGVVADGRYYSAMGVAASDAAVRGRKSLHLEQTSLQVTPLRSIYTFEHACFRLTLTFLSPLLPDRLDIMSRTVSYIEYDIEITDANEHELSFVFGISGQCCTDGYAQRVRCGKTSSSAFMGNAEQKVFSKSGDMVCIDWGYVHVADPSARFVGDIRVNRNEKLCFTELDEGGEYDAWNETPYILTEHSQCRGVITLGYDEIKSVEYFGRQLDEYYKKYFPSFEAMLSAAVEEYEEIKALCVEFDGRLRTDAEPFGEKYVKIVSLAYRQAMAAHKLCEDENGNLLFLSKECYSNGCIGTLDITYPSMPLFLKYNPELVCGMLRPIIKYACSDKWNFDFAPHDVGQFPLANGQVYGDNKREYQMPVEECGNMLICVAAYQKMSGNTDFARENKDILQKWADYLVRKGYNPDHQLCTDDFAGKLEQNCNLSIKAIMGIASYAMIFSHDAYMETARNMADKWVSSAVCDYGSKLSFNRGGTWSLKYNMVWDKLLGFGLFEKEVYEKEIALYKQKMNKYGVPLDCRASYSKIDWLMWTTVLSDDKEYFELAVDAVYNLINETEDRVPLNDWYDTLTAKQCEFQNRSVVGGVFINLLLNIKSQEANQT